jgi:Bacteriodetes cell division protein (FtsL-like)
LNWIFGQETKNKKQATRNIKKKYQIIVANKYREKPIEEKEEETIVAVESDSEEIKKPSRPGKKGVLAKGLSSVFSGTFLSSNKTIKHLPYILFLALIAIFYIANGYHADDKIRQVNKLTNEIKEKHSEFISTTSELMFMSKQSEVAKAAEELGLKEPVVPPTKILVDSTSLYKN